MWAVNADRINEQFINTLLFGFVDLKWYQRERYVLNITFVYCSANIYDKTL